MNDDDYIYPMMWLRMDPLAGEAIRRVPIPGSSGRWHVDLDKDGVLLKQKRSFLRRLVS